MCVAMAVPTALWAADDNHDHSAPTHGSSSQAGGSHGSQGTHGSAGGSSGQHGSMGTTHHTYQHRTTTTNHTTNHTINHTTNVTRHETTNVRTKVDVSSFHRNFAAPHAYHYGDYHGPAGYVYQRWGYGQNLPREYWAQNYWINNYLNFGLMGPPDGYVWVRYGPDAVLIDEDTGDIIQVEYGVFY
jgi:Ni/Co efflux regulator RcnB